MTAFTIKTRLTPTDYFWCSLPLVYRKWSTILVSICGLFLLAAGLSDYREGTGDRFYTRFELYIGAIGLLFPVLSVLLMAKRSKDNPVFRSAISYTFSDEGVHVLGETMDNRLQWPHFTRYREAGKFLLLFNSKMTAMFIDKSQMTAEQLVFIKSQIKPQG